MGGRESTVAHGPEHGLERLIFFSDAVFAIVITLLVIELHAPILPRGSPDWNYWAALIALTPHFIGFFISFFVIGFFWAGHHRTLSLAAHYSPRLVWPNLMLLAAIAAVPFFTAFTSANPMMRVPIFCYCAWLLIAAILNRRLQAIATSPPVVGETASPELVAMTRERGLAVILGAATAMLISIAIPVLGQVALATIPLWRLMLGRIREGRR
ncbi:TMEM175 family protein [Sphingomonas crusticola]|uniref:TMEM175 family protein n=1 Tax=Sphingomonas crusticola TaxID=1697973 RepID=UPI0013C2D2A9|nr:TMEM175 family protein [Sphingomonas crusticola]